jgi:protein arginine kinase activator
MLCQKCKEKTASVQITQTINNQKTVVFLCDQCANDNQDLNFNLPFDVGNILVSMLESMYNNGNVAQLQSQEKKVACRVCGLSFDEFSKNGKFGCSSCYQTFSERLGLLFRKLHGSAKHTGKTPSKEAAEKKVDQKISKLRVQLEEAIKLEEYEKAAVIRDKIKQLKIDS